MISNEVKRTKRDGGMDDWNALAVRFRRDLHQIPELAFSEVKTQAYLKDALAQMGIAARPMAGTGLVAEIVGKLGRGRAVALRADMDGLPVSEDTGLDFSSQHAGVMHACGHDGHMAMLLAAAAELNQHREFSGTVRLVFQPSEERLPGGAVKMIAEGVLEGIDEIYGVHLWSTQPVGTVEVGAGPQMAAADEFRIIIHGRGGHGSEPEATQDAVVIAALTVVNLQTIVSRRVPAQAAVVVSCGTIAAGGTFNVIAERAEITGTVRTYDAAIQSQVESAIGHIAHTTAELWGASAEVTYHRGVPAVVNHPVSVERWLNALASAVVIKPAVPKLGAEDFAYYLQQIPGAFMFIGAEPDDAVAYPQHSAHLNINEEALAVGRKALVAAALASLGASKDSDASHPID